MEVRMLEKPGGLALPSAVGRLEASLGFNIVIGFRWGVGWKEKIAFRHIA